ncbi:endonuclease domain-containing protein [Streptomyces luteogriseus]|uniref:endonuclease domain-containing protein n=1 Tax=Streptomyces luteogriseus TaxID=68233 RepID=UPI003720306E
MTERTCDVPACGRQHTAWGYCDYHYREWKRCGVAVTASPTKAVRACSFDGCGRQRRSEGLCTAHYLQRFKGKPLSPIRPRIDTTARDEQGRKLCQVCQQWLPTDSFYGRAKTRDGLATRCKRCHKAKALEGTYGVALDWYWHMLEQQGGKCAICRDVNNSGRHLYVDHDHGCCPGLKSCGQCVRALLCDSCNRAIGLMRDDAERLEAAAAYVRRYARE